MPVPSYTFVDPAPKLVYNMSVDSPRKFEYQSALQSAVNALKAIKSQKTLNEHRFELIKLPGISSKSRKVQNLVPNYSMGALVEG